MPVTETGTRARQPDSSGFAPAKDGLRLYYEVFGSGSKTIVIMPATPISHSRLWKGQVHYLARHFRVVTYDGRGNGLSDHPSSEGRWLNRWYAEDCRAVMDATGTEAALLVGICSDGVLPAIQLAVSDPERVLGIFAIAPGVPFLVPPLPYRAAAVEVFDQARDSYEGWFKHNRHYMTQNFRGFLEFWFSEMFPEPHSTKQIEDAVAYGLDGSVELNLMELERDFANKEEVEALCRQVRCPVLVVHGDLDHCQPFGRGVATAELTGGRFVELKGVGHVPNAREPVRINRLISEFAGLAVPSIRRSADHPRALLVSSPIGLGHAWRDVAIARALRRQVPGLEVEWLAQPPLTTLLVACGEKVHPASAELAPEALHVDAESGQHELHAFNMLRRMDEILCANFMVFQDVVAQEHFDVWIADEGWEVDHFLHENPELKTSKYVWMSDFVGYLPMPSGGEREAFLTADYNAEVIEHVDRNPGLRDLSIFIGNPGDVVPRRFGPGLPSIPAWTEEHFKFAGYVLPFDPRDLTDTTSIRHELGFDPARKLIVATVGGSAVGVHLLHRIVEAFRLLRDDMPEAEMLLVCGPRIEPGEFAAVDGMRVAGYVHDLSRTLASCDLAVVQSGLSTTMELVATGRPFIYVPLRDHFEQNFHVAHRLQRYGAPAPTQYDDATPEHLAAEMLRRLRSKVEYAPVETDGAVRAASLIAPLITMR
ncbi:MAG TPA: alpha/beta fold hydrolase [Candidatus Dormibacteraeota bacterium]|nr:alpha/beta fold hydrolase [Candidatus Dormibacteraeota bacterium]